MRRARESRATPYLTVGCRYEVRRHRALPPCGLHQACGREARASTDGAVLTGFFFGCMRCQSAEEKNPYQGCIVAEDVTPSSRSLLAASLACVPAPAPPYRVPRRVRASTSIGGHACTLGLSGWFHCDGGNFFFSPDPTSVLDPRARRPPTVSHYGRSMANPWAQTPARQPLCRAREGQRGASCSRRNQGCSWSASRSWQLYLTSFSPSSSCSPHDRPWRLLSTLQLRRCHALRGPRRSSQTQLTTPRRI